MYAIDVEKKKTALGNC